MTTPSTYATDRAQKIPVFYVNRNKDLYCRNLFNTGRVTSNSSALVSVTKTSSATLTAAESGPIAVSSAGGAVTLTLPATVVGLSYYIYVTATSSNNVQISPNASDKVIGLNDAGTDNKDMILADPVQGDYIKIIGDGVDGWFVQEASGTWTRE